MDLVFFNLYVRSWLYFGFVAFIFYMVPTSRWYFRKSLLTFSPYPGRTCEYWWAGCKWLKHWLYRQNDVQQSCPPEYNAGNATFPKDWTSGAKWKGRENWPFCARRRQKVTWHWLDIRLTQNVSVQNAAQRVKNCAKWMVNTFVNGAW